MGKEQLGEGGFFKEYPFGTVTKEGDDYVFDLDWVQLTHKRNWIPAEIKSKSYDSAWRQHMNEMLTLALHGEGEERERAHERLSKETSFQEWLIIKDTLEDMILGDGGELKCFPANQDKNKIGIPEIYGGIAPQRETPYQKAMKSPRLYDQGGIDQGPGADYEYGEQEGYRPKVPPTRPPWDAG